MPVSTAETIIDFIFNYTPSTEHIEIGFFGGEPLLEFDLITQIVDYIHQHDAYSCKRVSLSIVSNGTIFTQKIRDFIKTKKVGLGISCDGPPHIHNLHRCFPNGTGSAQIVADNIRKALQSFPLMPVNAVYSPRTLPYLPDIVEYFAHQGVKNIYLNPNISAKWTQKDARITSTIYHRIGQQYINFYHQEQPRYINLIDSKLIVILRGGYQPLEKCRMGSGEFAFTPSGNIYPCERLIKPGDGKNHCIGNIHRSMHTLPNYRNDSVNAAINLECQSCSLADYCMNWCGCTNYYATRRYDIVSPFICASEKAAIHAAFRVLHTLNKEGINLSDHLAGNPLLRIIKS
jgi:uncharacterized protein